MLCYKGSSQEKLNSNVLNKSVYQIIPTDHERKINMAK